MPNVSYASTATAACVSPETLRGNRIQPFIETGTTLASLRHGFLRVGITCVNENALDCQARAFEQEL